MIRVQLLGHFLISTRKGELSLPTVKSRMLAAYLLYKHGQWVRRDFLRGMFWGDMGEIQAASNLRQNIYFIKKALKEAGVERDIIEARRDDALRINAPALCMVDIQLFESKAIEGLQAGKDDIKSLVAATSICRGNFLEGVDDDWCLAERRRISDLHIEVLKELIERMNRLGLYYAAIPHAHNWIKIDQLNESAYLALINLYLATGQAARAMQQFEICTKVLEEELGVPPSEDTLRICKEIGLDPDSGPLKKPGKNSKKASQSKSRSCSFKNPSKDPLRNACFLLVLGEDKAFQGDIEAGMEALEKALSIYKRLGSNIGMTRAKLTMASAYLYTPLEPRPDQALSHIKPVLSYYKSSDQPAALCRALYIAADASWQSGRNEEAFSIAKEGLDIAISLNDKGSVARFSLVLGITCINEFRLKEAWQYIEIAARELTCYTETPDVLRAVLFYGVLLSMASDLSSAERYFRETIAMLDMLPPTPKTKQIAVWVSWMLILVLYLQDKKEEAGKLNPLPTLGEYFPPYLTFSISLLLPTGDLRNTTKNAETWFRANLSNIAPYHTLGFIRQLTFQLLEAGLIREAARWAAAGVRLSRSKGYHTGEAVFHSIRAVSLARQGRSKPAATCRNRAEKLADETDRWVPAYIAWVDGLIAKTNGEEEMARESLTDSTNQFDRVCMRHHSRLVREDLKDLEPSPALI